MTRTDIMNELAIKGMKTEKTTVVKNGVSLKGIIVRGKRNMDIAPVIYTDELIREAEAYGDDVEQVARWIMNVVEKEDRKQKKISIDNLNNRNFVLEHLMVGAQRTSEQDLVKKDSGFDGIELYLYIRVQIDNESCGSLSNVREILKALDISEEEAWEQAKKNIHSQIIIKSIPNILGLDEMVEGMPTLYVLTIKGQLKGAGAIIDKEVLRQFAKLKHTRCLGIFPSSVHEFLLMPDADEFSIEELSEVVSMVNEEIVLPEDRLSDRAYKMRF